MRDIDEDTDQETWAVLDWIESQPEVLAKCRLCAGTVWDESRKLHPGPFRAQSAAIDAIARQIEGGFRLKEYTNGSEIAPLYNSLLGLIFSQVDWVTIASRFVMEHCGFAVHPVHPEDCECQRCLEREDSEMEGSDA